MDARSLSPVGLFILLFLGSGIYFTITGADMAFYKVSAIVCIMPALFLTVLLDKGSLEERTDALCRGFANQGIAGMIFIFFLAGGFAAITKGVGCVQEAVFFTKHYLPESAILLGTFIVSALIAMALGTSMGVIGVLGPFVVEMAQGHKSAALWLMGAVVSGGAFGDNLSLVSDTSIAASQTLGVNAKDKFLSNLRVAILASLFVVGVYGLGAVCNFVPALEVTASSGSVVWWKLFPYIFIIVIAMLGTPVVIALFVAMFFTSFLGIIFEEYSWTAFAQDFKNGIFDMTEVAILSFCLGGLQSFVIRSGAANTIAKKYPSPRKASWVIAKISVITDIIFANNTVAILFSGATVKKIAEHNNIPKPFSASLMDIFATATQCVIPHGAQLLLASTLVGCSPLSIMPFCFYSFALYVCGVVFVCMNKRQ